MRRATLWALALVVAHASSAARAQAQETDAQQRQAAAEAFDRGTAAYIARDYPTAAEWFETADRLAPAPVALAQAIRSHERAQNLLRAGNLALRMNTRYPQMAETPRITEPILQRAMAQLVHVVASCDSNLADGVDACRLEVDGALVEGLSVLVDPGADHTIVAHFETGAATQTVSGAAGDRRELSFVAPPPPPANTAPPPRDPPPREPAPPPVAPEPPPSRPPFSPVVFFVSAGVTLAITGVAIWSGVDTLGGVDAYEANPTQSALEEGQAKELRTNVLIIGAAAAGVVSAVIALFVTDWSGEESSASAAMRASVAPLTGGAAASLAIPF